MTFKMVIVLVLEEMPNVLERLNANTIWGEEGWGKGGKDKPKIPVELSKENVHRQNSFLLVFSLG